MSDAEEEKMMDLSNPDVVTKYRLAGDIANAALAFVVSKIKVGALIVDVCSAGDAQIMEATGKIYKGKKVEKGIAFPTCLSVNNIVGHFSPEQDEKAELKAGDVCKIDLGVHVDGFIAVLAHTVVAGAEGVEKATGKAADLLAAVHNASELALRMVKVGNKNTAVTEMISKVADDFKVNAVHGVLSHQMDQFSIDGEKTIINKADVEEKVDEIEFEPLEVYAVDIVMSTGEGKPKGCDIPTTVFKRQQNTTYQLKMKASRAVLSEITKSFSTFPFSVRAMETKAVRFGLKECLAHDLLAAYPVLTEKDGELVAHAKFTVLLMPNGPLKIAGPLLAADQYDSELAVLDEDMKKLLLTSAAPKKKKKNKKKK